MKMAIPIQISMEDVFKKNTEKVSGPQVGTL
jgi:hypothetical protein